MKKMPVTLIGNKIEDFLEKGKDVLDAYGCPHPPIAKDFHTGIYSVGFDGRDDEAPPRRFRRLSRCHRAVRTGRRRPADGGQRLPHQDLGRQGLPAAVVAG